MGWRRVKTPAEGEATLVCSVCGGAFERLETVLYDAKRGRLKHLVRCHKLPMDVSKFLSEIGTKGGRVRSPRKRDAVRANLARARAVKFGRGRASDGDTKRD